MEPIAGHPPAAPGGAIAGLGNIFAAGMPSLKKTGRTFTFNKGPKASVATTIPRGAPAGAGQTKEHAPPSGDKKKLSVQTPLQPQPKSVLRKMQVPQSSAQGVPGTTATTNARSSGGLSSTTVPQSPAPGGPTFSPSIVGGDMADVHKSLTGGLRKSKRRMTMDLSAKPINLAEMEAEAVSTPSRAEQRQQEAARWTDREVRKLIAEIIRLGQRNAAGQHTIAFGPLFEETGNIFEALSGTLVTAKKHGVVQYEGQLLLQRAHDDVVIILLKQEIEDSTAGKYMRSTPAGVELNPVLGHGFGNETLKNAMLPCHQCGKTVYPMEFIGASDKVLVCKERCGLVEKGSDFIVKEGDLMKTTWSISRRA